MEIVSSLPVGVMVNVLSVLSGGIIGGLVGKKIPQRFKDTLPVIFGFAGITIGVMKIVETKNLTIVIMSLVVGTIIGELIHLEDRMDKMARWIILRVSQKKEENQREVEMLVMVLIIFCISSTGIYGAVSEGFAGDSSILLSKSVLDFFTAIIFGSIIGYTIAMISIPQILILLPLYFGAVYISPYISDVVLGNFIATGGVITMIFGTRMANMAQIKAANTMPALIVVIILSMLIM